MAIFSAESQCHGKRAYIRRRDAVRAMRQMLTVNGMRLKDGERRPVQVYRCTHCSNPGAPRFHIGHAPPNPVRHEGTR